MNKHLDKYLCKKYPKIFADRYKPMNKTCMCWGFNHGDGWFLLLDSLCYSIQRHIDHPPFRYRRNFKTYCARFFEWLTYKLPIPTWHSKNPERLYEISVIPQVVAAQVKEKFGGLKFYYNGGDDAIQGMIKMATCLSYHICEKCGAMNELVSQNSKDWIKTTCPCCTEKNLKSNHKKNQDISLIKVMDKARREPKLSPQEEMKEAIKTIQKIKKYK